MKTFIIILMWLSIIATCLNIFFGTPEGVIYGLLAILCALINIKSSKKDQQS